MVRVLISCVWLFGLWPCVDAVAKTIPEEQAAIARIRPSPAYFEKRGELTRLNFDFEIVNRGADDFDVSFIGMRVFDADGDLLTRRYMGANGAPGPIAMLPEKTVPAGGSLYVFNPFPDLRLGDAPAFAEMVVAHSKGVLEFRVTFERPPGPVLQRPPLDGVSYVYTGNDLFAHHRRVALNGEAARSLGMERIAQRFALDFTRVDPKSGDLAVNDGAKRSDWHGYGAAVFAPIGGRVAAVRSDMPENDFDAGGARRFPDDFDEYGEDRGLGNFLILEVGDGAFLIAAHFMQGTPQFSVGDVIEAGDYLGRIGMSGDTAYPHLHIQLQNGRDLIHASPLPISFACVVLGQSTLRPGAPDTGDFVSPCGE